MQICVKWVISGRVQGVGYRASCFSEAMKIGNLKGWVRNLNTGEVEVVVQGDLPAIQLLKNWCEHGPRMAAVSLIQENAFQPQKPLEDFKIL